MRLVAWLPLLAVVAASSSFVAASTEKKPPPSKAFPHPKLLDLRPRVTRAEVKGPCLAGRAAVPPRRGKLL